MLGLAEGRSSVNKHGSPNRYRGNGLRQNSDHGSPVSVAAPTMQGRIACDVPALPLE